MVDIPARSSSETTYSGFAAEALAEGSTTLAVICPDLMPGAVTGGLTAGVTTSSLTVKNRDGVAIGGSVKSSNHIIATWEGDPNKRRPGMVAKGEPVKLIKRANQDKYTWAETGLGRSMRTHDVLHMEIGASDPSKPGGTKDDTNTYSCVMDSVNKIATFKTSKANGEAVAWNATFDMAKGVFYISDDTKSPGNRIYLDTQTPMFQVNLHDGTTLQLNNGNGFIKIPKGFQIDAGERIVFNAPLVVLNVAQVGSVIINCAYFAVNSAKDIILNAANVFGVKAVASKIMGGVLVAAGIRVSTFAKGSVGAAYTASEVADPTVGEASTPSNNPDTDDSNLVVQLPVSG